MKKIQNYENFEIDNYKSDETKIYKSHFRAQIFVFLFLVIIFQIIFLVCVNSYKNKKNSELLEMNFKKYLLEENNSKLYSKLNEDLLSKYSLEEEIQKKEKQIQLKEGQISEYKQKSKTLLKYYTPTIESFVKAKESNDKRISKINELKLMIKNSNKEFREKYNYKYNTKILDSMSELSSIESFVKIDELKLCYRGENNEINYSEAYDKCQFHKNSTILVVFFQNNLYERYGALISSIKENYSFIFSFNNGKIKNMKYIDLNYTQRQSLIYIVNCIKKDIFDQEHKYTSNINDFIVTDLEIFQV